MNGRILPRCLALLAVAAMALPMWGAANMIHKNFDITRKTQVNGTMLQPGNYEVVVSGHQAKFEQKGKVIANVPCTWNSMKTKSDYDALLYTRNELTGLQFEGQKQSVSFTQTTTSAKK